MNVLITGIAGHLGSALARWIIRNVPDCEVFGFDNLSCGYPENVPDGVAWVTPTLGKDQILFTGELDYVFHFAAYAAEGLSPFIRHYNYQNNLLATADVVNFCINKNVKRLVFTSSMAVYGRGAPPFYEGDDCRPIDPYGVAKLACEQDIQIAGEQHGLDWCIIRPHNIYGPGQSIWQKYRNVLGIWMARHLAGEPLLIYGDGRQERAFSYIDDIVPCLWQAAVSARASQQIVNLGGTYPKSIASAARELVDVMGDGEIVHVEPRHEVKQAYCSWEKSVELLGFRERVFRNGLEAMWEWARDAWKRYPERRGSHQVAPVEIEKGLYSFWKESCFERAVN